MIVELADKDGETTTGNGEVSGALDDGFIGGEE